MKRTGKFEWTPETDKAFIERKGYLISPLIMVAPTALEPQLLYIVATPCMASTVLVVEWESSNRKGECGGSMPKGSTWRGALTS
jgi:hypothetical protein